MDDRHVKQNKNETRSYLSMQIKDEKKKEKVRPWHNETKSFRKLQLNSKTAISLMLFQVSTIPKLFEYATLKVLKRFF